MRVALAGGNTHRVLTPASSYGAPNVLSWTPDGHAIVVGTSIVNLASGTAFKGTGHLLHYVASKGAVVSMTRSLARELGPHNICVNAIAPGLTMSEAVVVNPDWTGRARAAGIAARAIQRDQVPADLISTLVYLCSDESGFVTGQTISVDGGALMR